MPATRDVLHTGLAAAPDAFTHDAAICDSALVRAFGFLGKRWNGLLLGILVQRPAGFAELKRSVPGISDPVLSDRLKELSAAGLVKRVVDEGPPVSVTYQVTPAGQNLMPVLASLTEWARENLPVEKCTEAAPES
jgi:DNA-binding HxlR family transcriptional regulator